MLTASANLEKDNRSEIKTSSSPEIARRMKLLFSAIRSSDAQLRSRAADDFEQFGASVLRRFVNGIRGPGHTPPQSDQCIEPVNLQFGKSRQLELNRHKVTCDLLCESPRIQVIRGVLKEWEARELIEMALARLRRSQSFTELSDDLINDTRTSYSASIPTLENELSREISNRAAKLCDTSIDCLENLHVTRYEPGQFFAPHHDFFPPSIANVQSSLNNGGQRVKSLLIYLNNLNPDDPGGATLFPRLNLAVKCEQGSGILWDNVDAIGELDYLTQHAAIAPEISTKFVLTVWSRERPILSEEKSSEKIAWQSHELDG